MTGTIRTRVGREAPHELRRLLENIPHDHIKNGQTSYDTGTGFFLGDHNGVPKLSVGNSAGNKVTWDGSTLTIVGTITATVGAIGGWTLAANYLSAGSGANTVRIDSGGTNPAISAGSATPASAPFRVTQAGALTATSGAIGGWTLGVTALTSGSGATTVGLDSGGTNPALYAGSATPGSAPFRVTQAGALTATSATITGAVTATSGSFTGGVTVGTGGSLSSGQSAYDTGTGFWFEYNGGTPRFSIGNASGNKLTWNGTTLSIVGVLNNAPQTFTPTWAAGFSVDPTGDFSYIDFGAYVLLWSSLSGLGTSDDVAMSITNLPTAIRPSDVRSVSTIVVNNGQFESGYVNIATDGNVYFFPLVVVASRVTVGAFTAAGDKAWPNGALIAYPK